MILVKEILIENAKHSGQIAETLSAEIKITEEEIRKTTVGSSNKLSGVFK